MDQLINDEISTRNEEQSTIPIEAALNRLQDINNSMRSVDQNDQWKRVHRVLSSSEVDSIVRDLETVTTGISHTKDYDSTLKIIRRFAEFEYMNPKSDINHAVQEAALKIVIEHSEQIIQSADFTNPEQVGDAFNLIRLTKGSNLDAVRASGVQVMLENQNLIMDGLQNEDPFYFYPAIEHVLEYAPSEQKKSFLDTVSDTLSQSNRTKYYAGLLSGLVGSDKAVLREAGEEITTSYLEKRFGLDGRHLISAWLQASGNREMFRRQNLNSNLLSITRLEEVHQGSAKVLYDEFGIVNFGRYLDELLITQYEQRNDEGNYGVILYPRSDWNGAFHQDSWKIDRLQNDLSGDVRLRVYEIGSKRELAESLIRAEKRYGKINFALIGGHGTDQSISFGKGRHSSLYAVDIIDYLGFDRTTGDYIGWDVNPRPVAQKVIDRFFVKNPDIILISCSTGGGDDGGIARKISKLGARVIGPDKPTALSDLGAIQQVDGSYKLVAYYTKSQPKVFINGEEVNE